MKDTTIKAKQFLKGIEINKIKKIINEINFSTREKTIIDMLLDHNTQKEISIELNLSISYLNTIIQQIYKKISMYIEINNSNT